MNVLLKHAQTPNFAILSFFFGNKMMMMNNEQ